MPYTENKSICNDWILKTGHDDYTFSNNIDEVITVGEMRYLISKASFSSGYYTPPNKINVAIPKNYTSKDETTIYWGKVLSHEFLHYILDKYFDGLRLDNLCNCVTDDLDESGLCKYTGWGDVY
jgi:hypothetical protein